MTIDEAIKFLDKQVPRPSSGLPKELFFFISRITPLVNVDLLIKNERSQTLLAWRDDQFVGAGWHIPGGIVRFKENWETRLQKVAEEEIGTPVKFDPIPIAINQITGYQKTRGHFISILFRCFLSSKYPLNNKGVTKKDKGFLAWHKGCPTNLIRVHHIYKKYI